MTESSPASPGPIVLWLSSRYENLELGQAVLEYVCRLRGIENDAEHWIGVALREALANAIKHGNRQDPARRVMLSLGGLREQTSRSSSATRARGSSRPRSRTRSRPRTR